MLVIAVHHSCADFVKSAAAAEHPYVLVFAVHHSCAGFVSLLLQPSIPDTFAQEFRTS